MKTTVLVVAAVFGTGFFATALNNGLFGNVEVSPAAWLGLGALVIAGVLMGELGRLMEAVRKQSRKRKRQSRGSAVQPWDWAKVGDGRTRMDGSVRPRGSNGRFVPSR